MSLIVNFFMKEYKNDKLMIQKRMKYLIAYCFFSMLICLFLLVQGTLKLYPLIQKRGGSAARFGGDEFVFFFPFDHKDEVNNTLSCIQEAIKIASIEHQKSLVSDKVTLSIGAVIQLSLQVCYNAADEQLYKIKETGRGKFSIKEISN